MAAANPQAAPPEQDHAAMPDYLTDSDAVLKDQGVKWRYGRPPDYSKTRKVYAESESCNLGGSTCHHLPGLPCIMKTIDRPILCSATWEPRVLCAFRLLHHAR